MKYFLIQPIVEEFGADGNPIRLGYKMLFEALITAQHSLDTEQFLMLVRVWNKFKDLKDNDILEVEDNEHELLKSKLNSYLKIITERNPLLIKVKVFQDFVDDVANMKSNGLNS